MKKLLYTLLIAFTLGLFVPMIDAATPVQGKQAVAKKGKKKKKKHRKHRHHRHHKHKKKAAPVK
jgi:Ni/Co efflux regulator RcnB